MQHKVSIKHIFIVVTPKYEEQTKLVWHVIYQSNQSKLLTEDVPSASVIRELLEPLESSGPQTDWEIIWRW